MTLAERSTERPVRFAVPDIGEAEIEAVVSVLRSGWITTGPKTKEFEAAFAVEIGAPNAVMVNSCTSALHLALEALGVGPGDEVIVPAMTFASTAAVVAHLGATPVLVDVRAADHNIDPSAVEKAWSSKTRVVIPVHFAGLPCDMEDIVAIARANGANVVDDAAHCFPCDYRGRAVGTLADITCFSFYATKTITTAEGGAAVTSNGVWADRMRLMSLHGLSGGAWKRYLRGGTWKYDIEEPGFKYNMTDIGAAMGLVQLGRARALLERRRQIAEAYDAAFADCDAFDLPARFVDRGHAHHLYVLKVRHGALGIGRDELVSELAEAGIGASVHFIPLHLHPYYQRQFGYKPRDLPIALDLYERSFSLPIYSRMSDDDVDRVIDVVTTLARRNA